MVIALAAIGTRIVDSQVYDGVIAIGDMVRKLLRQSQSRRLIEFMRKPNLKLAGNPGVFPMLGVLCCIPQCRAIPRPPYLLARQFSRQDNLCMTDIRPFSVVVDPTRPFIPNALSRPVRRGARSSPPLRAAERCDLQPKDGHGRTLPSNSPKRSARKGNAHPRLRRGALEVPGQIGKLFNL